MFSFSQFTSLTKFFIMKDKLPIEQDKFFGRFSSKVTRWTGSSAGFSTALLVVVLWGASGPLFHYSAAWEMIITTVTGITTFLMVFLIQKSQNKDSLAIQLKLNELLASHEIASNRLVNVENMTEEDLQAIQKYYQNLSDHSKKEGHQQQSYSIDEVDDVHGLKEDIPEK